MYELYMVYGIDIMEIMFNMAKNKNNPMWAEAKKKCRLNTTTVEMAREMGLNPKSLIKNIPNSKQQWKAPVHVWIQEMYEERFGEEKIKELIMKNKGVAK